MICYTLDSVLQNDNIDLIDEAIADTYSYKDKVSKNIWAMYRYYLINAYDLERWKQRVTDRVTLLHNRYSVLFSAYDDLVTDGTITALDSVDTDTETRDLAETSTRTTSIDSQQTTHDVGTSEALPATSGSSASSWLTNRDISDGTVTGSNDGTDNGSTTDKGTVKHERVTRGGMIPAELYERMKNSLYDPYYEYAREFDYLFVPYYADECGRCGL